MLINYNLCFDDEQGKFVAVNPETGELREFTASAAKKTTTTRKKKADESTTPQLILSDNKYSLNTAAVELMGVEPEAKLNIKMRKIDGVITPVLGTDEAFKCKSGNRLTKSFTVACRGANNEALAAYGTIFELTENPDGSGTFILKGEKTPELPPDDEAVAADVPLPEGLDVDLDSLDDDIPNEESTIDGSTFESMLAGIV